MINEEHFRTTSLDADLVEELLPQFLKEMSSEFEKLLANFNNNDHNMVRDTAHRMRGTAQAFGAFKIEQFAENIELKITLDNQEYLLESIEELRLNLKSINLDFAHLAA